MQMLASVNVHIFPPSFSEDASQGIPTIVVVATCSAGRIHEHLFFSRSWVCRKTYRRRPHDSLCFGAIGCPDQYPTSESAVAPRSHGEPCADRRLYFQRHWSAIWRGGDVSLLDCRPADLSCALCL